MKTTIVALDCGFGFCKGVTENRELIFPSIISAAVQRTFLEGVKDGILDPKNLIVTYQDETFFVGELALNQGHYPRATLDKSRTRSREMEILFLTSLALLSPAPVATLKVVTGLPVTDFGDREWVVEHFTGTHELTVNGVPFKLTLASVAVIPQPYGSYMNALLDERGADVKIGRGMVLS